MKKKSIIRILAFVIIAFLLIFTSNCNKSGVTGDVIQPPTIPVLTTSAVTGITPHTAICGGNITWGGGTAIIIRGVCWSTSSQSCTIEQCLNKIASGANIGNFTSFITGLNYDTTYYIRAYATNSSGTGYGNLVSFKTVFHIGQSYEGGIIFYIDKTGQHGLISATSDQCMGAVWGCKGILIGGTGTTIGTGQANTKAIVSGCNMAGTAARICDALVLNGYSDWFLPSQEELNQMIIHTDVIGRFALGGFYWSSSESSLDNAWTSYVGSLLQRNADKGDTTINVRAVRAF